MKKNILFIVVLVILTAIYGGYSTVSTLFLGKSSHRIKAEGLLLDKAKVYALTNMSDTIERGKDTVIVPFDNNLMPTSLGFLANKNGAWKFYICSSIVNIKDPGKNVFYPWCSTIEKKGLVFSLPTRYFNGGETIDQDILKNRGIKFNTCYGDKVDRVLFKLSPYGNDEYMLNTRIDGLGIDYPVFTGKDNIYEVYFGDALILDTTTNVKDIFTFPSSITTHNKRYLININNGNNYTIADAGSHAILQNGKSARFLLNNIVFSVEPIYNIFFTLACIIYFFALLFFQAVKLYHLHKGPNPLIRSIYIIQIGLNCVLFLGIKLMILAQVFNSSRWLVMLFAVIMNIDWHKVFRIFSDRMDKYLKPVFPAINYLQQCVVNSRLWLWVEKRKVTIAVILLAAATVALKPMTHHESLLGFVPILHVAKALVLVLVYFLPFIADRVFKKIPQKWEGNKWVNIGKRYFGSALLLSFAFLVSYLTSDFGSFLFIAISLFVIAYMGNIKGLRPKVLLCIAVFICFILFLKIAQPNGDRKYYRFAAFVIPPSDAMFDHANESDRETFSDQYLMLKDKLRDPSFTLLNDVTVAPSWHSTFFSDFSVLWSIETGGELFLILFLSTLLLLVYNFLRIIYIVSNTFALNNKTVFAFSETKGKLLVFLLTLTMIQFVYPLLSNCLCIFLTGQSVPCLSSSMIEIVFIFILLFILRSVYNNRTRYYKPMPPAKSASIYEYTDLKVKIRKVLIAFGCVILGLMAASFTRLADINNKMTWTINYDSKNISDTVPSLFTTQSLIRMANETVGSSKLVNISQQQKERIKYLASLFYNGKPLNQVANRPPFFQNSTERVKYNTSIDSLAQINKRLISAEGAPFGDVYTTLKFVNGKPVNLISNRLYSGIVISGNSTVNADLNADLNAELEKQVKLIGKGNTGSIVIIDNATGGYLSSASYPFFYNCNKMFVDDYNETNYFHHRFIYNEPINAADVYQLPGSIVKPIIAYAALLALPDAAGFISSDGFTFTDYLKCSKDLYSAEMFERLLLDPKTLDRALYDNFGLPLCSNSGVPFIDKMPQPGEYHTVLDKNNSIYRLSIGQQNKIPFRKIVECYARIMTGKKISASYFNRNGSYDAMALSQQKMQILHSAMHGAICEGGTAAGVGIALKANHVNYSDFICKTGTAQLTDNQNNATSSFILCTDKVTIGIQLSGSIPENIAQLGAKHLFAKLIPKLIKYNVLEKNDLK